LPSLVLVVLTLLLQAIAAAAIALTILKVPQPDRRAIAQLLESVPLLESFSCYLLTTRRLAILIL
jgi:hypothetical protein